MNLHIFGKNRIIEVSSLFLDPLENDLGLLAFAHEDHAFHCFGFFVEAELPQARRTADSNASHIFHKDRNSIVNSEYNISDIFWSLNPTESANIIELATLRIESTSGISVVARESRSNVRNRKPCAGDFRGVEQHLILHCFTAESGIIRHAKYGTILPLDDPIFDRFEFHRGAIRTFDNVAIDQTRR